MIAFLIIGIISGACSLLTKKYKILFNYMSFIMLVLVMSCNNNSPDEQNIEYFYDRGNLSSISLLFWHIAKVFSSMNISFGVFNFFIITSALILIVSTLKIYTKSWGAVIALYSLSAACLDATLFRYFIGYSFIIYGFRYLLVDRKVEKYFIWVVIAALFHYTFLIYMIFAFMYYDYKSSHYNKKNIKIIVVALVVITVFCTYANGRMVPGVSILARLIDPDNHSMQHLQQAGGHWGWLISVAFCITNLTDLYMLKRSAINRREENELYMGLLEGAIRINLLSCFFIPLCIMYFHVFSRLFRPLFWLTILCIIIELEHQKSFALTKSHLKTIPTSLLYLFIYTYCFNYIIYSHEYTIEMILNGSLFWCS